ncbi:MAG: glutathione peroxidase [Labilithrix sp.]|nr:glutathione peroxidase [Labilithrix sp.]
MRRARLVPLLAVCLAAFACTPSESPAPAGTGSDAPSSGKPKPPDTGPADVDDEEPAPAACTGAAGELYALSVTKLALSDEVKLCTKKGSVLLIVNGASHCGYTVQYEPLQALYAKYKDQKFEVLAFPSKSFNQEKDTDAEVSDFCTDKYKITFPLFTIAPVVDNDATGEKAQPVYQWLRQQPGMEAPVPWNFEKFLISRDGKAVKRFAYTMNPDPAVDPTIDDAIKAELAK